MTSGIRVVALVCEGVPQRYLANRLAAEFALQGIVVFDPPNPKGSLASRLARYLNPVAAWEYLVARIESRRKNDEATPLIRALFDWQARAPEWPVGVPLLRVANINEPAAVDFVRRLSPDVLCVNGTNLLRAPMLDLAPSIPLGIVNLHTGLSPYSRGGNCNLFMVLEGHPELVGITIHYIDRGIDSGDIIRTARPQLAEDDTIEKIDAKCFRLGFDLLVESVRRIAAGEVQRVKQWEHGKLFLKRTGYVYKPYYHVVANRKIARGLIRDYLRDRAVRDRVVRLVGDPH